MALQRVAVLGAGTMGHGIAYAALAAGFDVQLFDVDGAALDSARASIGEIVAKALEIGKLSAAGAREATSRLGASTDLGAALDGVDLVIEAAPERLDLKLALFAEISRLAPPAAFVVSNTSALSITEMAATLADPTRVA